MSWNAPKPFPCITQSSALQLLQAGILGKRLKSLAHHMQAHLTPLLDHPAIQAWEPNSQAKQ